jgi:predicted secreted Zn-dependent protease
VPRPRWLAPALALIVGACAPPPPLPPAGRPPAPALTAESRAALALAESLADVPAEVSVTDDTARYPVIGSTAAEIRTQLRLDRYDIADSDFVGLTKAEVQWQFRLQHVDSGCVLAQIAIFLHFETLLPQWLPPTGRQTALAAQWQRFLSATEIHEQGHRNIALHTAAAIDHLLHAVRAPACQGLRDVANLDARTEWDLGDRRQRAYDAGTQHGGTQGARWPP